MKKLILVRHAKTEPLTDAENDFERRLKKRGCKDARLVSDYLIGKDIKPGLIISSPARRALQTAQIMAGAFSLPESEIIEASFIYDGFSIERLIKKIEELAVGEDSLMVVGHNPDIALMAIQFAGDNLFNYPTAATSVISFSVSDWHEIGRGKGKTELFITPKDLKKKE
jgi:phosphohistidine phosphatase